MSTVTGILSNEKSVAAFMRRHPLVSYFFVAYAGTWIVISPLVMHSAGWIQLPDGVAFLLFFLSTLAGPALAAFWVTGIVDGTVGVSRLLRRIVQFRAGVQWYAIALFIFLGIWLIAYGFLYNGVPWANLFADPGLLISVFLPNVIIGFLIPSIGEEPGWRGFALPRLQQAYGPVLATLILGSLHGFWHLPALLTPMLGPFTWDGFITFVLTAAAGTFIYTWVFNNTNGSIWIAMLLHTSSNAASRLVSSLIPVDVELSGWMKALESGWLNVIVFTAVAIALVIFTRGTLGYRAERIQE